LDEDSLATEPVTSGDGKPINRFVTKVTRMGVRYCVEVLLFDGASRDYVAAVFCDIPFPSTDDPTWDVSWAFEDWDDWVAAEESVDPDGDASTSFSESH
jgi:predicted nucleotidyltransferase